MSCSLEFSAEFFQYHIFFLFNRTDIFILYLESPVSPKTLNVKLYGKNFTCAVAWTHSDRFIHVRRIKTKTLSSSWWPSTISWLKTRKADVPSYASHVLLFPWATSFCVYHVTEWTQHLVKLGKSCQTFTAVFHLLGSCLLHFHLWACFPTCWLHPFPLLWWLMLLQCL